MYHQRTHMEKASNHEWEKGNAKVLFDVVVVEPPPRQTILGNIPSKSNCYKIVKIRGYGRLAKTQILLDYEKNFAVECSLYRNKNIDTEFSIEVDVYFSSKRSDLDGAFKILMDSLQKVRAIKNDNLCYRILTTKHIDKGNPRIEFTLTKLV